MWPFSRKPSVQAKLLESILAGELKRREIDSNIETNRAQLELRKLELEGQQLEARGEEMRRDRADREKLRQERIAHAARIREIRAEKKRQAELPMSGNRHDPTRCKACRNPSDPSLTADEIEAHYRSLGQLN